MPANAAATSKPIASCSFCHKPNTAVQNLVAGPGVFICNECVELSAAIVADVAGLTPGESARLRAQYTDRSAEEILDMLPGVARTASRIEADLARWVSLLRERGTGWQQIADALGTSAAAARQRFGTALPG
jgi:ClpX C4-type zinc finger